MTTKEYYKKYSDKFHDILGTKQSFTSAIKELYQDFEDEINLEIDKRGTTWKSLENIDIHREYIKKWNQLCRMFKKYDGWSPISPQSGPFFETSI